MSTKYDHVQLCLGRSCTSPIVHKEDASRHRQVRSPRGLVARLTRSGLTFKPSGTLDVSPADRGARMGPGANGHTQDISGMYPQPHRQSVGTIGQPCHALQGSTTTSGVAGHPRASVTQAVGVDDDLMLRAGSRSGGRDESSFQPLRTADLLLSCTKSGGARYVKKWRKCVQPDVTTQRLASGLVKKTDTNRLSALMVPTSPKHPHIPFTRALLKSGGGFVHVHDMPRQTTSSSSFSSVEARKGSVLDR